MTGTDGEVWLLHNPHTMEAPNDEDMQHSSSGTKNKQITEQS
jgi:hypothetical protein